MRNDVTKCTERQDAAVSPVVGVMLMLVVTIIIAAVVAVFASGMVTEKTVTPTAVMDVSITSLESTDFKAKYPTYGEFTVIVQSISEPLATKYVRLETAFSTTDPTGNRVGNRTTVTASTVPNTQYAGSATYSYHAPTGFGPGVAGTIKNSGQFTASQDFGNYTLQTGTTMSNSGTCYNASGSDHYPHTLADAIANVRHVNALDAILGTNWIYLKAGDLVSVSLIDTRSNGIICAKEVVVA